MYVKIVKRKFETGNGTKNVVYHYLAEKIRNGSKVKDKLIRKLSQTEITAFIENKESFLHDINSTNTLTSSAFVSSMTLRSKLTDLINEIKTKEEPYKKSYRPQKFSELFLVPLLE